MRLAREGGGREVCGILAGTADAAERIFPIANVHEDPVRRYRMDPQGQLRAYRAIEAIGQSVVAYYHSHPDFATGVLSATDLSQATEGDYALYALVHGGTVHAFAVDDGAASPVPVEIAAGT